MEQKSSPSKNNSLLRSTTSNVNPLSKNDQQNNIQFNQLKLSINSGIISHINTQILSSFTDFYGFLLGRYKLTRNTKSIDSNSNYEQQVLSLNVENVIFIFDKNYLKDKLD